MTRIVLLNAPGLEIGRLVRKQIESFLELITVAFLFAFTFGGLDADFFVILLEGGQILTGLGEFTLFHAFSDVPMNEGALGVHEIELVIDAGEHLSDGGGVGDHAASAHNLGEIAAGDDSGWLVVDTALETGGGPIDELDGALGLDCGDCGVDILGDNVTTVHHTAGHILTVTGITLNHHAGGLEHGVCDLGDGELLVVSLLGGDDRGVGGQHKMDTRIRHKVGLELSNINVQSTIESEGCGQGRDDLAQQTVQIGVGGALDVEVATADIVEGLVVNEIGDISVLEERVNTEHCVVWLHHSGSDLGATPDSEGDLRLLAVIDGETLEEKAAETGASATTDGVEDHESLKTSAVVRQLADAVQNQINNFFANRVMASREIVAGIFLARDQLLGMEQLTVGTRADLIDDGGLQINEDGTRNVFSRTSLTEEGVETIIATANGLVRGHLAIGLNAVLEAEKLPASISDLDTGLTNVNEDGFAHNLNWNLGS